MKIKHSLLLMKSLLLFSFVVISLTGCKDNDDSPAVAKKEVPGYVFSEGAVAQVVNMEIKNKEPGKQTISFVLRTKSDEKVEVAFDYDESLVKYINEKNGKEYVAFPKDLVSFSQKVASVAVGELSSNPIEVIAKSGSDLIPNTEYLIPVKVVVKQGAVSIPEKDSYLAIVVKQTLEVTPKPNGIKIFSCMEINDANPLNHLSFRLKNSGAYFFDAVILFSTNMQYNSDSKRVHLSLNAKNKVLFDNVAKYVKPLQDKGIKVLFSVLPHHTAAGLANLTDETCKAFAAELKKFNDKYGLDGVFLDDEYGYKGTGDPSVLNVFPTTAASSRLAYEIKKVMPDKWTAVYTYNNLSSMVAVEGKDPGSFIDYIMPDYFINTDYTRYFKGVPKERAGIASLQMSYAANSEDFYKESLKELREDGFGLNMIFGLNPDKYDAHKALTVLNEMAKILYDDELVYDGVKYASDWSDISGDPKEWEAE